MPLEDVEKLLNIKSLDRIFIIKFTALMFITTGLNELLLFYLHSRCICMGWALACLWVLLDGVEVALHDGETVGVAGVGSERV